MIKSSWADITILISNAAQEWKNKTFTEIADFNYSDIDQQYIDLDKK